MVTVCVCACQVSDEGEQNEEGGGGGKNVMMTIDDTEATPVRHYQLDGLEPDTRYRLTVRAHNGLGWSDYSQEFMFRTAPGPSRTDFLTL